MLKFVSRNSIKKHTATVIFMHGLGDSGHGWAPVADNLSTILPHVKFIFPHASTSNSEFWDVNAFMDEKGLFESFEKVKQLIKSEIDSGISSERIVVGGFSQGAAMAYLVGLTLDQKLSGIAALSGYVPIHNKIFSMVSEQNKSIRIFAGHGTADPVVRYELGLRSVEELKKNGYNIDFHTYNGLEHSTCPQELMDLANFLQTSLPENSQ
ncbi:hypothetical protein BB558_001788 [Smittium angustum]|uniref:Acyl-protein thioesterase 1 n=1 Tax=Smittium angustum TaxID=133377 RepID=A0A2U1JAM9_SMIAN|nr:hypothetical protein BB558_001788 [Smittium angustum]